MNRIGMIWTHWSIWQSLTLLGICQITITSNNLRSALMVRNLLCSILILHTYYARLLARKLIRRDISWTSTLNLESSTRQNAKVMKLLFNTVTNKWNGSKKHWTSNHRTKKLYGKPLICTIQCLGLTTMIINLSLMTSNLWLNLTDTMSTSMAMSIFSTTVTRPQITTPSTLGRSKTTCLTIMTIAGATESGSLKVDPQS